MNVVFISPQFPSVFWQFCDRLKRCGANVLAIGDIPYDALRDELKEALTEYYYTPDLADYDSMFRAVAFLSYRYGKIDWLESNNEYWLSSDARLRDDFHIVTGASSAQMEEWRSKSRMKPLYQAAGIPCARKSVSDSLDDMLWFAGEVGFPLFAKPEYGMGSLGTCEIPDEAALRAFHERKGDDPYVVEELIRGQICSYDAIFDSRCEPLFENMTEFPRSMSRVASERLDMAYACLPYVDPRLQALGRAAAKSFGIASRFAHMEFFRLDEDRWGLGAAGDYVGIEVNMRPPGGNTPDMMNWAHSCDVYQIWAEMVTQDRRLAPRSDDAWYCVFASQRDCHAYAHTRDEILARFGESVVSVERIAPALSDDMGDTAFIARVRTDEECRDFVAFVHERREDA